jgi:hypothetical protein
MSVKQNRRVDDASALIPLTKTRMKGVHRRTTIPMHHRSDPAESLIRGPPRERHHR